MIDQVLLPLLIKVFICLLFQYDASPVQADLQSACDEKGIY